MWRPSEAFLSSLAGPCTTRYLVMHFDQCRSVSLVYPFALIGDGQYWLRFGSWR